MAKIIWKDVTSYSRDAVKRIPGTFECELSNYRLVVTRHFDYPGQWLLRCVFGKFCIADCPVEEAQAQALTIFKQQALDQINALEKAIKKL